VNFDEYEAVRCGSLIQRIFKLPFGVYIKAQSPSEYLHELVVFRDLQDLPPLNDAYQHHYNSDYEQNMDQTAHGI